MEGVTLTESRVLHTADGVVLEAEYRAATAPARSAAVLCHPHPQYGGTMRSLVISALFDALPARGHSCLRFNFRGVGASSGEYGEGAGETEDVRAAVEALGPTATDVPLAVVGWSFGADMALSVVDRPIAGWVGIAPPLRFRENFRIVARDERPKHLVLAQHDEFRAPAEVQDEVSGWTHATTEIVAGASHFFVGRTDQVITASDGFLASLGRV
jgi:uncharacterized protein